MDKQGLIRAGINYQTGVERFSGHTEIYEKYLKKFLTDPIFPALQSAMNAGDYEAAFFSAHTLKGLAGNLGMERLFGEIAPLTEMLRNQSDIPKAIEHFPQVCTIYLEVLASIKGYFEDASSAVQSSLSRNV